MNIHNPQELNKHDSGYAGRLLFDKLTLAALEELEYRPVAIIEYFDPPLTADELLPALEWLEKALEEQRQEGKRHRGRLSELPAFTIAFYSAAFQSSADNELSALNSSRDRNIEQVNAMLKKRGFKFGGFVSD